MLHIWTTAQIAVTDSVTRLLNTWVNSVDLWCINAAATCLRHAMWLFMSMPSAVLTNSAWLACMFKWSSTADATHMHCFNLCVGAPRAVQQHGYIIDVRATSEQKAQCATDSGWKYQRSSWNLCLCCYPSNRTWSWLRHIWLHYVSFA